ncbi:MAG: choice-of-anchor D domain-containing protein, partial [Verrucomicrobiae bacterium]|nr:choice-of-anchor D domain-containing protein [Verrucomicrobiae bacterium]
MVIRFDPTVTGSVSDVLTIQSNDPDSPSISVSLSGSGIPSPEIHLADSSTPLTDRSENFGEINADGVGKETSGRFLTIENRGSGPLTIRKDGISLSNGTDFKIVSVRSSKYGLINLALGERSILPGGAEKWSVGVLFDPTVEGDISGSLRVASDDPDEPNALLTLIGRGRPMGRLTMIGSPTFDPAHADGVGKEMSTCDVSFQNSGEVSFLLAANPFKFSPATHFRVLRVMSSTRGVVNVTKANQSIAPKGQETWTVTLAFDPTGEALKSPAGSISDAGTGPTPPPVINFPETPVLAEFLYPGNYRTAGTEPTSPPVVVSGVPRNEPDIKILDNAGAPDDWDLPFGSTEYAPIGSALTKTFTIRNVGVKPLVFDQNGIGSAASRFVVKSITSARKRKIDLSNPDPAYRTLLPAQADVWTATVAFEPPTKPGVAPIGVPGGGPDPNHTGFIYLRSNDPDERNSTISLSANIEDTFIELHPRLPNSSAPSRFLVAGEPVSLDWVAGTPRTKGLIDMFKDSDDDFLNGWSPIVTKKPFTKSGSVSWTATPAMIGQRVFFGARLSFPRSNYFVTSYSALPFSVISPDSKPIVRSQLITTSEDYAWEVDVNGTQFTGNTKLTSMGSNWISVPVVIDGISGVWEISVNRVASMLDANGYTYDEMQRPKTFTNGNGITT